MDAEIECSSQFGDTVCTNALARWQKAFGEPGDRSTPFAVCVDWSFRPCEGLMECYDAKLPLT